MDRIGRLLVKASETLSIVLLIVSGLVGIVVAALDFMGTDFESGPWRWLKGPLPVLLSTTAILAIGLGLERLVRLRQIDRRFDDIDNTLRKFSTQTATTRDEITSTITDEANRIITSSQTIDVRFFRTRDEAYIYLEKRVRRAKTGIHVTNLGNFGPTIDFDTDAPVARYQQALLRTAKERRIPVRRVQAINTEQQMAWLNKVVHDYEHAPLFIGCYPKPSVYIAPITMVIIDKEEVYITGGDRSPSYDQIAVSIRNAAFTNVMQQHWDVLWRDSVKVKEREIRRDLLDQLNAALK